MHRLTQIKGKNLTLPNTSNKNLFKSVHQSPFNLCPKNRKTSFFFGLGFWISLNVCLRQRGLITDPMEIDAQIDTD